MSARPLFWVAACSAIACSEPAASDAPSASTSASATVPAPAQTFSDKPPKVLVRWDSASPPRVGSFLGDDAEDFVGAFTVAPDRTALFAVDGGTMKIAWQVEVPGGAHTEHRLRFSVVQKFVAWTLQTHQIHVLDAATGNALRTISLSESTVIDRLCPQQTNIDQLMAPTKSGYDAIVFLASGREANNSGLYRRPACPLPPPPPPCAASTITTTDTRVYALSKSAQLQVLDAPSGKLLGTFGDPDPGCR